MIRYFYKWFIFYIFFSGASQAIGQESDIDFWRVSKVKLVQNKISQTEYLRIVDSFMSLSYSQDSLPHKLAEYYRIINKFGFDSLFVKYYSYMMRYSLSNDKFGLAIYYAEKKDELLLSTKYPKYFTSDLLKIYILTNNFKGKEAIDSAKKLFPDFSKTISLLETDTLPINIISNMYKILMASATAHDIEQICAKDDSLMIFSNNLLLRLRKIKYYTSDIENFEFNHYYIQYHLLMGCQDYNKAHSILNKLKKLASGEDYSTTKWKSPTFNDLTSTSFKHFYIQKKFDSASYYLNIYNNECKGNHHLSDVDFLTYTADVHYHQGRYKIAYENLIEAFKITDTMVSAIALDASNNLYATKLAEDRYNENIKLIKKQKNMQLVGLVAIGLISIFGYFGVRFYRKKNNQLKQKLLDFDNKSRIDILLFEENIKKVKLEEQTRLGYELHDTYVGDLALIKHKLNFINNSIPNANKDLNEVEAFVEKTYKKLRNKSHTWYQEGESLQKELFTETISKLIKEPLPANVSLELEIEDDDVSRLAPEFKVEILKVLQEVIVNILKHAKANNIFLNLHVFENLLYIIIKDNGKVPFDKNAYKLNKNSSLNKRLFSLNGTIHIERIMKHNILEIQVPII